MYRTTSLLAGAWVALASLALGPGAPPGRAAEAEAQNATAAEPKPAAEHPMFATRAMRPPFAAARLNNKQQRLRDHHISVRIPRAPAGVQAMPKPAAETAAPS